MYRLLLFAVALPLLVAADLGHAAKQQFNFDIVAIDLAGRETNLTHNPAVDVSPAVARSGRIVFVSTRGAPGGADLYVMDRDGRNVRRLTNGSVDHSGVASGEDLEFSQGSWSPRGDRIAFDGKYLIDPHCPQHCANWEVLVIDSNGSGVEQIARGARAPAWSPDGRRLAYQSGVDAYYTARSLTITRLDGSGSVQVEAINGESYVHPVWSPRGDELAFQAQPTEASPSSVYIVRSDGRRKRRLAAGRNPTWSPNGRRLAFIDNYKLMTIDRNGKARRRLSRPGEFVVGAAWSPKGGRLAYIAGTALAPYGGLPRNLRVETVTADGKGVHVLLRKRAGSLIWGGVGGGPVWTPNGKRILVTVERH
jgi:Tol biopolymer transport system component